MAASKNIRIFVDLVRAGRLATLVLAALVVLSVVNDYREYQLTGGEVVIALIGTSAAFAFVKTSWLLVFHDLVYRSEFEGSPFVVAALVCLLQLVALSALAYLGNAGANGISAPDLLVMLGGSYVAFTILLWLAARFMHLLFRRDGN